MLSIGPFGLDMKNSQPVGRQSCIVTAPPEQAPHPLPQDLGGDTVTFGAFWNRKPSKAKLMIQAAGANDRATVQKYLDEGLNVDVADKHGERPIIAAAYAGHHEMVQFLLDNGADANRGSGGDNLLMMLMGRQYPQGGKPWYPEVARVLIPATANINRRNLYDGATALNMALKNGYDEVVDDLLAAGADPTIAEERSGLTPLMYAAWRGKDELAHKLIMAVPADRREAYISQKSRYNRSALRIAQDNQRKEVIVVLRQLGAAEPPRSGYDDSDEVKDKDSND